jgi:hypothetical protein
VANDDGTAVGEPAAGAKLGGSPADAKETSPLITTIMTRPSFADRVNIAGGEPFRSAMLRAQSVSQHTDQASPIE